MAAKTRVRRTKDFGTVAHLRLRREQRRSRSTAAKTDTPASRTTSGGILVGLEGDDVVQALIDERIKTVLAITELEKTVSQIDKVIEMYQAPATSSGR